MKDEIMSVVENMGEFVLDSVMPEGILKDLPIIGPVFSGIKIGKDIRDRIFVEKLKSFIENIDRNQKWQEKFSNVDDCNKISKYLLYIINSCDDDNKLRLIGIAFNCFVNGEISRTQYFYIVHIISKSFYPFLEILLDIDESDIRFKNDGKKYDYTGITHLLDIGLLEHAGQTVAIISNEEIVEPAAVIVALNDYGIFLKKLVEKLK